MIPHCLDPDRIDIRNNDIAETTAKMNQRKALGVWFSMSDFGTGQSFQQKCLQENGCAICQGYLSGRPMPLDAFVQFLA